MSLLGKEVQKREEAEVHMYKEIEQQRNKVWGIECSDVRPNKVHSVCNVACDVSNTCDQL